MKTHPGEARPSATGVPNRGLEPPRQPATSRIRQSAAGLLLASGMLSAAGSVLPWETVTSSAAGTVTRGGLETSDALVFLVLGCVIAAAGILGLRRAPSGYWRGMLLFVGIMLVVAASADAIELQRSINAFNERFSGESVASLGIGMYAIGFGAILSILGAVLLPGKPRPPRVGSVPR